MKYWKLLLIAIVFILFNKYAIAQQNPTVQEYYKVYPTYDFSDPSPIPLLNQVYPYFRFDGFTDKAIDKKWKVIALENEYIKLEILPEIGGKIWTAFDKKANRPFLYDNHTIKFRDIAMRGPWTSGGLESNFGIIGHTPNCATPVDYIVQYEKDSSITCTIGALDLLTRCYWRLKINLPKNKAYFTTQGYWYNPTEITQPYYHWMNAGIPVDGQLEYSFPGNSYIGHNGEHASWPINEENGKDISWYDNNDFGGPKSYHVFGKYTDFFGAYWHKPDFGMARYSLHGDKLGKKIWIWGLSRQGMIWENLLTDTDGQYSEIQSGRLFNQTSSPSARTPFKHYGFEAEQTDSWKEFWYPVHNTKGITEANELGAFNFSQQNGKWNIRFSPIISIADTFKLYLNDSVIYQKYLQLDPLQTFEDSITNLHYNNISASLGKEIFPITLKNGQPDIQRPKDIVENIDWNSVPNLYQLGRNTIYEKNYSEATKLLNEALHRDSNFIPTLNALAELNYRQANYRQAASLLQRALSLNTYDGEANYLWGIVQRELGNITDAKDGFDVASLSPQYRVKANIELAKIFLIERQLSKSQIFAGKALENNQQNVDALQLLLVLARIDKNKDLFETYCQRILAIDPLNHFARFERLCNTTTTSSDKDFKQHIKSELPYQTFLEMAIWYHKIGADDNAIQLLQYCKDQPEAQFWLAYLQQKQIDCAQLNMSFSFPFRTETRSVLQYLLTTQTDWQLKYSLGLLEYNLGNILESRQLLNACSNLPDMAAFYAIRANIGIDSMHSNQLGDLIKAEKMDPNWRYKKLLAEYYFEHHDIQTGLNIVEPYFEKHPNDYIFGMLYAKGLILDKKYKACDNILTNIKVLPYEGATNGHELYKETKLMQAVEAINNKKVALAHSLIDQAKLWPENLGVGKPYDQDIDTRLEDWLEYQNKLRNEKISDPKILSKIISFEPTTSNTIRNFSMVNNLISAWAIEITGGKQKATQWLSTQKKHYPNDKEIDIIIQYFNNKSISPLLENSVSARVLDKLNK